MLITPDSSYFGGIQSWTYQDFDFLYSPGQRLGMPRMRTCSLVTAWLTVSPGCAGVHTEKDSEKVAQHCTLVYHCHDCTLVNCAGVHTEKDSEKVAQHCAASSLCSVWAHMNCTKDFNSLAKNDPSNDNWVILRAARDRKCSGCWDCYTTGTWAWSWVDTGGTCGDWDMAIEASQGWDTAHYQGIRART